jgi:hypothetical protein
MTGVDGLEIWDVVGESYESFIQFHPTVLGLGHNISYQNFSPSRKSTESLVSNMAIFTDPICSH